MLIGSVTVMLLISIHIRAKKNMAIFQLTLLINQVRMVHYIYLGVTGYNFLKIIFFCWH